MNINIFDGHFNDFECFKQPLTIYKVSTTTVDFVKTSVATSDVHKCIITSQNPATLNKGTVDYSKEYYKVRSPVFIDNNDFIEYKGKNYKVFQYSDFKDYGFYNCVIEEYKQPIPGVA